MSNVCHGEEDPGVGGEVEEGSQTEEEDAGQGERLLHQPLSPGHTVGEALPDGVLVQQVKLQLLLPPRLILTDMAGKTVGKSLGSLLKSHIFLGQHPHTDWQSLSLF